MASVKTLDTSDLTIAASGSSVVSSTCRIRCTLEVSGIELRHTRSIKVLLINEGGQPLRITPGVRSGVQAQLLTGLELTCAPGDTLSFTYNVPISSLRSRRAFALVEIANDTFGFLGSDLDEVVLPVAGGFVVAAAAVCAALVLRKPESRSREQTQPLYGDVEEKSLADRVNVAHQRKIEEFVGTFNEVADPEDFVESDRADDPDRADARNVIEEPDSRDDVETASYDGRLDPPAIRDKPATAVPPLSSLSPISRQYAAINVGDAAVVGSIECVGRRPLNLLFVAKVANQANEPLMCSVVGEARDSKPILFPDYFWVQPQSAAAVEINTSVRYPWKLDRLVLRMQNSGLSCTAETVVPVPLAVRAMHMVAMTLLMVFFGAITYAWFTRPHIQAFAAPQSVVAGRVARVSYETQGRGTTAYLVSNDSGTVQRGQLPMGRHQISFRTSNRPQLYRVLLTVDGFAGGTSVEQDVRAFAPQRAPLARTSIDVLEVNPPIANAGAPFEVRYVLSDPDAAKSGTVSIFDSVGFPVVSGPINASGVTSLVAPSVTEPTTFRVALDVSRNGLHSQAATGLLVMPKASHGQNAVAEQNFTPDQLLQISPKSPRSQQTLIVRPRRYPSAMSITLQNDRGEPIGSQHINSGNGVARFHLPVVERERKMTVIASYVLNGAQHVAIKSIVVRPTTQVL